MATTKKTAETRVTDSDLQVGNLPETPGRTKVDAVDLETLDSPASAKGPGPGEIPAPRGTEGDLATANLSEEADREDKRVGTGAVTRGTAPEQRDKMIAALLREREGLAAAGKSDRIAQVDEQLQHHGYDPKQKARDDRPQGRTSTPPQQTTIRS